MPRDPNATRTQQPGPPTAAYDTALDAGLAAAFGLDATPGGWSLPPLLRDDPSEHAPLVQPTSAEMPRGTDDRYQLLGEIARGGMGVVLKGRDPDLGRDLAFKVLRQELSGKPAAVQRFVEEAQVGGQLQHPGIVPVYDLGRFGDGRPYFAMKLVKGRTLADLLAERTDPTVDRGRYLRHFLQVCNTLAYAHSKGVLHRDMKPSNVMVGAFDEVLVMDWGLAKVLARGGVADEVKASRAGEPAEVFTEIKTARFGSGSETEAGSVMGTPAFMPPEQAGGEIDKLDERADVFGLGAVLCVILTGKPPYVSDSGEALRLMAVRGQLDECFARLDACGADAELVGICKRSLSVNREARPRDAAELAELVSGYLTGVETRAHDAEIERERAEVRHAEERKRQRTRQTFGGIALLVLLAGAASASWQWWRAESEEKKTRAALDQVTDEKAKTADALAQAKVEQTRTFAALNTMTDEGVERLMTSQLEMGPDQNAFIQKVIDLYTEATKSQIDTPEGRAARAHGYFSVGKLRQQLEDYNGAIESFTAADKIYDSLVKEFPMDRNYRLRHAENKIAVANPMYSLNRVPDAEREIRQAKTILEALVAEDPLHPDYSYQLARAEVTLARALKRISPARAREAEALERVAIRRIEQLVERFPRSKEYSTGLMSALANHSLSLGDRSMERETVLLRAVAIGEQLIQQYPNDPNIQNRFAQIRNSMGVYLNKIKNYSQAETEFRASKALWQKLVQRFSAIQSYRLEMARTLTNLGNVLVAQERYREAEAEYRGCATACEALMNEGAKDSDLRIRYVEVVNALYNQPGNRVYEDKQILRAIDVGRGLLGENPALTASKRQLARLHELRGRFLPTNKRNEKIQEYLESIRIYDEVLATPPQLGSDYHGRSAAHNNLANQYPDYSQNAECITHYRAAIADYEAALAISPDDKYVLSGIALTHNNLARQFGLLSDHESTMAHVSKSRDYLLRLVALAPTPENREQLAQSHYLLGNMKHNFFSRPHEAAQSLNAALEISRKLVAESPDGSAHVRTYFLAASELARVHNNRKQYDEADRLLEEVSPYVSQIRANNRDTFTLSHLAMHLGMAASVQARKGDHATASKAIPGMLAIDADSIIIYHNAACILNNCIIALKKDPAISEQVRKDLMAGYTEQALGYLRQGIEKGFRNREAMESDPDMEVFRMHPEFQRMVEELRTAREVAPKPREAK